MFNFIKRFRNKVNYEARKEKWRVCFLIGEYYLQLAKKDFPKIVAIEELCKIVKKDILQLGISNVEVIGGYKIVITLSRPGILIGRRGENIEALHNFLSAKYFLGVELELIEQEDINQLIIPSDSIYDWEVYDEL